MVNQKKIILIAIGCNYQTRSYKLGGCINDAVDISTTIYNLCNKNNIDLKLDLCLDNSNTNYPSKDNILKLLRNAIYQCNSNIYDNLIFYFAGHGFQVSDNNKDEYDLKDELILTADGKTILDDELFLIISKLNKKVSASFIFDCCHSGTILDLPKIPIGKNFRT